MRRLAHALAGRGWHVDVWTTTAVDEATWRSGFAPGADRDGDVAVHRFPVPFRRHPALFRQVSRLAYHLPRGTRPEHLWAIIQGPYAPALVRALARARDAPTLFSPYLFHSTLYGLPAAARPRLLCPAAHDEPALRLDAVARAVAGASGLWFHSEEERLLLRTVVPAAKTLPSECGVVGVDPPAAVDSGAFARQRGIAGPYLYFGGRAAPGKGIDTLVEGAARAVAVRPQLRLVLSGEVSTSVGDRPWIVRAGRLDERERWEAIAGATTVIVPGRLESLSLLALEAWAVGRPCLLNASSAVLAGHASRSRAGLLFRDADELARHAVDLVDDPARARALGDAGRRYVTATYRWDLAEARLRRLLADT